WTAAAAVVEQARRDGGALAGSWHDRSLAPGRLWGRFYARLLEGLARSGARFMTAARAGSGVRPRRSVGSRADEDGQPGRIVVEGGDAARSTGLTVRFHVPGGAFVDVPWRGEHALEHPVREPVAIGS